MRIYKLLNKRKIMILWLFTGLILGTLLIFPAQCRNGAANGMFLCIQVLVPSLFPFMILSSFLVNSGILCRVPKVLHRISTLLFGLDGVCFGVVVLSVIGGYPIGASGIKSLYKNGHITTRQAERMSMFCVSAGPGFLVTYIGAAMTRQPRTGYILLVSQIISVVILGIFSKIFVKDSNNTNITSVCKNNIQIKASLVEAVNDAINSALKMCAMVIIFGSIAEIYIYFANNNSSLIPFVSILEISNGIKLTADKYPLTLISAFCGFGGLCVHFQVFEQLEGIKFSKSLFFTFRLIQALLCSLLTKLLLLFFPVTRSVISTVSNAKPEFSSTVIGCIFLLIACMGFLISVKSIKPKVNNNQQ